MLVVVLLVNVLIVLSSEKSVVVAVASRGYFVKILVCMGISTLDTGFASVRVDVSVGVIDYSLSF